MCYLRLIAQRTCVRNFLDYENVEGTQDCTTDTGNGLERIKLLVNKGFFLAYESP